MQLGALQSSFGSVSHEAITCLVPQAVPAVILSSRIFLSTLYDSFLMDWVNPWGKKAFKFVLWESLNGS